MGSQKVVFTGSAIRSRMSAEVGSSKVSIQMLRSKVALNMLPAWWLHRNLTLCGFLTDFSIRVTTVNQPDSCVLGQGGGCKVSVHLSEDTFECC